MAVVKIYCMVMEAAVIITVNVTALKAHLCARNGLHGVQEKYTDVLSNEVAAFKKKING